MHALKKRVNDLITLRLPADLYRAVSIITDLMRAESTAFTSTSGGGSSRGSLHPLLAAVGGSFSMAGWLQTAGEPGNVPILVAVLRALVGLSDSSCAAAARWR